MRDAGCNLGIIDQLAADAIQRIDRIDHAFLITAANTGRIADKQHGITLGMKVHTLITAGQETAVPLATGDRLRLSAANRSEHDEPG